MITIQLLQYPNRFRTSVIAETDKETHHIEDTSGPTVFVTTEGHRYAVNFSDSGLEIHSIIHDREPREQWVSVQPDAIQVLRGTLLPDSPTSMATNLDRQIQALRHTATRTVNRMEGEYPLVTEAIASGTVDVALRDIITFQDPGVVIQLEASLATRAEQAVGDVVAKAIDADPKRAW